MPQYYFIVSRLHGLVLDVLGNIMDPGAKVAPWERNGGDNQMWYDDPSTGTIRTALNDFCLSVNDDSQLVVRPYTVGDNSQKWQRESNGAIRNRVDTTTVIDIWGKKTDPGAKTGPWPENGGDNQLWNFENV